MKKMLSLLLFTALAQAQLPDSLATIFRYAKTPVFYTSDSVFVANGQRGEKIRYKAGPGFEVSAFLIRPAFDEKATPLVIYQHWGEGDKREFLSEASEMAAKGFTCILPDGPWLCPDSPITSFKSQGFEMYRQCVIDAMKAIDLAEQHFRLDGQVFFAGHSFGCNTGAILSAVEPRIKGFIFMAGVYKTTENIRHSTFPDFVEWRAKNPAQFAAWTRRVAPLDASNYLPYKIVPCLIQVAGRDEYVSPAENDQYIRFTPVPKEFRKYDATHALNDDAKADRMEWIIRQSR